MTYDLNLIDVNVNSVPSHYAMTKSRPAMITKQYGATKVQIDSTTTTTSDLLPKLDDVIDNVCHQDKKQLKVAPKDMDVKVLSKNYEKDAGGGYEAGMIVGGFPFYLTFMIDHHLERGRLLVGNIMVLDSYDGAVHTSTNTKESGIVSYNSQVFHSSFYEHNITTATSSNILNWM